MAKSYRKKVSSYDSNPRSYNEKLEDILGEVDSFPQIAMLYNEIPMGSPLEPMLSSKLNEMAESYFDTYEHACFVYRSAPGGSPLEGRAYEAMVKLADISSIKSYEQAKAICDLAPLGTELKEDSCALMFKYAKTYDEFYLVSKRVGSNSELSEKVRSKLLKLKPNLTKSLYGLFQE